MTRDEIMKALAAAPTLGEQISLVAALDEHDTTMRREAASKRDLDWAGTVVDTTLHNRPRTLDRHTAATDWLGDVHVQGAETMHQAMTASAAVWWSKLPQFVKDDAEEFTIQARAMARRTASKYGEIAEEARDTYLNYVAFLNREVLAASGLDQIQQEVDSFENTKTTPLPTDVFDTFQPPIHPINQGVDGSQTNSLAPGAEEALSEAGSGGGGGGRPSMHEEGQDPVSQPYYPPASAKEGSLSVVAGMMERARDNAARQGHILTFTSAGPNDAWVGTCDGCRGAVHVSTAGVTDHLGGNCNNRHHAVLGSQASVAIGYTYNLDDFRREAAKEKDGKGEEEGDNLPFEGAAEPFGGVKKKEAASGLPQVQQTEDSFENPAAKPLPLDTMFPIVQDWPETNTAEVLDQGGMDTGPTNRPRQAVRKQADMYGASDTPHAVPGGETPVANSPATTPPNANGGDYDKGVAEGRADAAAGEAPSFSDASSHVSDYVRGYTEGFGSAEPSGPPQDVPASMGGDSGQAQNFAETQARQEKPLNMAASKISVSASLVSGDFSKDEDFQRGYRYASTWTKDTPLVAVGSAGEEAGIYAGITDNPAMQRRWVAAHRKGLKEHPELRNRLVEHRSLTAGLTKGDKDLSARVKGLYVQAATSLDLDTFGPSTTPDPKGSTPSEGPGTIPVLRDAPGTPAAPGGASPYNGTEPYGTSVVPNPSIQDLTADVQAPASPDAVNMTGDSSLLSKNPQAMAFRKAVQARKLALRKAK